MKRIEIIANRSIEGDLHDALKEAGAAQHYTKIPVVHGVGNSGPRMGDHIWPEENFIMIVYCEDRGGGENPLRGGEFKDLLYPGGNQALRNGVAINRARIYRNSRSRSSKRPHSLQPRRRVQNSPACAASSLPCFRYPK